MNRIASYWKTLQQLPEKQPGVPRILFFSDLHVGCFPSLSNLLSKRIIGACNHLVTRKWKVKTGRIAKLGEMLPAIQPDLVLCGGDLGTVSLPEEYSLALNLLAPIRNWSGGRFLFVPGNHDMYVNDLQMRMGFDEVFRELNGHRWLLGNLPRVHSIPGVDLLMVNPCRPRPFYSSGGEIPVPMAYLCAREMEEMTAPCRLALSHYPALDCNGHEAGGRHGLRGGAVFSNALRSGQISALLSGHVHEPYVFELPNGSLQICSGSLTMAGVCVVLDCGEKPVFSYLPVPEK